MGSKPVLVHVINNLGMGGAETLLVNTIPLLQNYDHVLICLSAPDTLKSRIESHLKGFHLLNIKGKSQWIRGIVQLRRLIRRYKPVLVHSHLQLSSLLTRIACPNKVPLVFTIHSTYSQDAFQHSRVALWLERLTVRKKHALIGVSRFVVDDYQRAVPFKGGKFILYNFVAPRFFNAGQPSSPTTSTIRLVAVGTLKEAKNYSFLLEAFRQLQDLPVHLDIYGDGPEKALLQQLIDTHRLNVTLKGRVDQPERVFPRYHVYIISSRHEGYGIAPLEAMAAGLPVLASSLPVLKEVIGEENALFFDLSNPLQLVQLIKDIIADPELLQPYILKSRDRAKNLAGQERYLADLNSIYHTIINP